MHVHQFAYKKDRCVEDVTLSVMNYILKFIENVNNKSSKHLAKALVADFFRSFQHYTGSHVNVKTHRS